MVNRPRGRRLKNVDKKALRIEALREAVKLLTESLVRANVASNELHLYHQEHDLWRYSRMLAGAIRAFEERSRKKLVKLVRLYGQPSQAIPDETTPTDGGRRAS